MESGFEYEYCARKQLYKDPNWINAKIFESLTALNTDDPESTSCWTGEKNCEYDL